MQIDLSNSQQLTYLKHLWVKNGSHSIDDEFNIGFLEGGPDEERAHCWWFSVVHAFSLRFNYIDYYKNDYYITLIQAKKSVNFATSNLNKLKKA